ncbi:glycosyltransferase family 2 protein [Candidatus Uhrbacteria bacterium]|nr:glycosyltransferase family 2 protein [Candidatus Uhrbacteria bacterium]
MARLPRVAVITVSYNHARFLRDTFQSCAAVTYPRDLWKIFLVDNASTDETVTLARTELIDETRGLTRAGNISAIFIASPTNTGFTGGNNLAIRQALAEGFEYVYLLNPDTAVEPDFLEQAVRVAEQDPAIGMVQSRLVLAQDKSLLNSWGNEVHYLGFSFCGGYRVPIESQEAVEHLRVRDIPAASGAAMLLKVAVLRLVGLLDDELFAYHEDVDLSWRMRLAGFRVVLAPESVVYHKYEFSRSIRKFYFMEKNRFLVHLKNLRVGTLILLAPALIVMELGLWLYAARSGWWREKARAYRYFFSLTNLRKLAASRRESQRLRVKSDRAVVRMFSPRISYQELPNPLWEYVGNHMFALYWYLVRSCIFW